MKYIELIESTHLVSEPEITLTTGDLDYPGTAIEVCDENGEDLFHIVVNSRGERHILFFGDNKNYRISLSKLQEILDCAKDKVEYMPE